ncbi:MAG: radical SAM protein [Thermodesulfovibrionales bacterium]
MPRTLVGRLHGFINRKYGEVLSKRLKEKVDYLLSKEKGTIFKEPGGKINIALVYPNTYYVGTSNLGFQGVYGLLNKMYDVVCERVFLPDQEDMKEYIRTDTELFSLESKRTLNRFDIVAFSVSFENDYPNILRILKLSRIPLRSFERKPVHPLIVMGGICAFSNPEPVADFFDICFIGEAEELLPEFLEIYKSSLDRKEVFERSLKIEGVYIPRFYNISYDEDGRLSGRNESEGAPEIIKRRYIEDINKSGIENYIVTPETEFSEMYLIEAMRGCPWSCRFCVAGHVYNPFRKKAVHLLKNEIRSALKLTKRVGLIGPSLSDYPDVKDILKIKGVDFSITSLRAGSKSAELVGLLRNHKSISIAPEAGTERLRKVIKKNITENDILQASERIFSEGIETLRLYFMIGLPTETREDIDGIVNLVKKIRERTPKGNINLSISIFVPKPFTPFQWHPMERQSEIKERLKIIKNSLLPIKGIRVFHDVPKYAYMQGLFSQGDRRVSKVIEEMLNIHDWRSAMENAGIKEDFYIFRKKEFYEILPWDFIDVGISKERLCSEYQEALSQS